jgi:hypothetical protein
MIPAQAVEAAALAVFVQSYERADWNLVVHQTKQRYIRDARTALEAAAPHMLAEAWEEGRQAEEDAPPLHRAAPNPYRSQS